jgi:hypothetical protein
VGEKAPVVGGLVSAATSLALPGLDPAATIVAAMGATLSVSWKRPLVALLILILVLDTGFALPLLVGVVARCRCAQGEHRHTIRFEEGRGSRPGCSEQRRLGAGSARAFIERIESFEHPSVSGVHLASVSSSAVIHLAFTCSSESLTERSPNGIATVN